MLAHVSAKAELENVCIDSTVVRARACAAGAANSNAAAQGHWDALAVVLAARFTPSPMRWACLCGSF